MRYEDFTIRILGRRAEGFHVTVDSPAGEASATIDLPIDSEGLTTWLDEVGGIVRGSTTRDELNANERTVAFDASQESSLEGLGARLYKALFSGDIGTMYNRSVGQVGGDPDIGLRIKLRLNLDDPDVSLLAQIPWEFVYEAGSQRFLALSTKTPVVRYVDTPSITRTHPLHGSLRILVVMSTAGDAKLDLPKERALITDTWAGEPNVDVKFLEHPTSEKLLNALIKNKPHVLHFMGHGAYDRKSGTGGLVLEDEEGNAAILDAKTLGTWLHDLPRLRLIFLNACDTGKTGENAPFAGVANRLVLAGMPAVVAMQFPISDSAAINFSRAFYARLVNGDPVDEAMAQGRKAILGHQTSRLEWGTPVLYMQVPDGRVFDAPSPLWRPGKKTAFGVAAAAVLGIAAVIIWPRDTGEFRWATTNPTFEVGIPGSVRLDLVSPDGEDLPFSSDLNVVLWSTSDLFSEPVSVEGRWEWRIVATDLPAGTDPTETAAASFNVAVDGEPLELPLNATVAINDQVQSDYQNAIDALNDPSIDSGQVLGLIDGLLAQSERLSSTMRVELTERQGDLRAAQPPQSFLLTRLTCRNPDDLAGNDEIYFVFEPENPETAETVLRDAPLEFSVRDCNDSPQTKDLEAHALHVAPETVIEVYEESNLLTDPLKLLGSKTVKDDGINNTLTFRDEAGVTEHHYELRYEPVAD